MRRFLCDHFEQHRHDKRYISLFPFAFPFHYYIPPHTTVKDKENTEPYIRKNVNLWIYVCVCAKCVLPFDRKESIFLLRFFVSSATL